MSVKLCAGRAPRARHLAGILGSDKVGSSGKASQRKAFSSRSPPEEGGSQPAGGGRARGRGMVGNQMGAGPCAQGGRVEGSDPLKEQWEAPEEFHFYGRQGEQQTDTSGSQRILLFVC